jgi:GTP-binding protein
MEFPVVSIVGRPNVGKSSLLNRLASRRLSIVDPEAGVTRDRVSAVVAWKGTTFELVDTGGMTFERPRDPITEQVSRQIELAIAQADLILFVVDAKDGITPTDRDIANSLRPLEKPVLVVANKADNDALELAASEFYRIGLGEPIPVSALHGIGRTDLLSRIAEHLPESFAEPAEPKLKLALVGRQNSGKSTLINTLAREERAIVSEVPGTTRDSYDVRIKWNEHEFLAIDTAGIKKQARIKSSVEFYSFHRSQRAIRRADVVLLIIDATQEISKVDKQTAAYIREQFKPSIIAVNKWDLTEDIPTKRYLVYIQDQLPGLSRAPASFISAKTGFNVWETVKLAFSLYEQWRTRVSTGQLNSVVRRLIEKRAPRPTKNRTAKIYYATQVSVSPPSIVLFVNHPSLFPESYLRYLVNGLQESFPFAEVPLKLIVRKRTGRQRIPTARGERTG